ncbi:DUF1045 domain-containing protein [Tabrizicola sp.]|uniref:DUF1045 domain-containing protein n=1 Tax=Tabrizicola sp. TaxID=2005166 RepID=UPI003F3704C3
MAEIQRYAVYYAPRSGEFADLAGQWLGRAVETGMPLAQPDVQPLPAPLSQLTAEARRYGFHGTIRAPFRPAASVSEGDVSAAVKALAAQLAPVRCDGLQLENLLGFLALTPLGCEAALLELGAIVVETTNALRRPLSDEDIARRRPETLTPRQRILLDLWGYPYVMEEFRFHLTLTDRLPPEHIPAVMAAAKAHFAPIIDQPFTIDDLCLFGEDSEGAFRLIHRYALTG